MFTFRTRLAASVLFVAVLLLLAASGGAASSPWCLDCHCLSYDGAICFCTAETTPGDSGFEDCWVQTVLGEDECILSGWCRVSGI